MVYLLTDDDVRQVLTMSNAIDAIEAGFRERGNERSVEIPRMRMYARPDGSNLDFWMNTMAAALPSLGIAAMRISTGITQARHVPNSVGLSRKTDRTFMFNIQNGEALAIIHNDYLSKLRVGASAGVAARHLARHDSRTVGVFGSGRQARSNLLAIALTCRVERVMVHSPTKAHCIAYCSEMAETLGVEVSPANPREVVEKADVLVIATNSRVPVFDGHWLKPGVHVSSVFGGDSIETGHELDPTTMSLADVVVVNSVEAIHTQHREEWLALIRSGQVEEAKICELGEVVAGRRPGRTSEREITVYDNNIGMGIQFAACGAYVLRKAREQGLGIPLEDAHFNEYLGGVADIGLNLEKVGPGTYSKAALGSLPN